MLALQNLLARDKRLRYLCQDETRVGLKSDTGKVITARGVKPVASVQWGRANFWIYGVVEPMSRWHFEQEYEHLNSEQFQLFLDALSQALGEDMALIQLDQAKAHQALSLNWAENLIPVFQPAYSPELNPIVGAAFPKGTTLAVPQAADQGRKFCYSCSIARPPGSRIQKAHP